MRNSRLEMCEESQTSPPLVCATAHTQALGTLLSTQDLNSEDGFHLAEVHRPELQPGAIVGGNRVVLPDEGLPDAERQEGAELRGPGEEGGQLEDGGRR